MCDLRSVTSDLASPPQGSWAVRKARGVGYPTRFTQDWWAALLMPWRPEDKPQTPGKEGDAGLMAVSSPGEVGEGGGAGGREEGEDEGERDEGGNGGPLQALRGLQGRLVDMRDGALDKFSGLLGTLTQSKD